jgi:putative ABC transport system permease protein
MISLRFLNAFLLRPLRREPVRAALTAFAVALGVAVVLAIELAGRSATGSFHASLETLVGKADLEITAVGGVPETVLARLVSLPFPLQLTARMEDYAVVGSKREAVPLVGLDLVAHALEQSDTPKAATAPSGTGTPPDLNTSVWLGAGLEGRAGERITMQVNDTLREYTVAGILSATPDSSELRRAVVMDIGLAQRVLRRPGRIDRILVRLPQGASTDEYEKLLRAQVPAGVNVGRWGKRSDENRKMLAAFRWNLRLLSYISLIVGSFLIYNTISVSVVRRRAEIGILRAVGATRAQVLLTFLCEAEIFGLAGVLLGIPLGRLMAEGAVRLLGSTVESLYVSSAPFPVALTPGVMAVGFFIGMGVTLASALSPALEAARVAPVEAMARGMREYQTRVQKGRDAVLAAIFAAAALAAAQMPPLKATPVFGYVAALLLIVAAALAMPAIVAGVMRASAGALRRLFGVEAVLASRSLSGSLRRTAVLTAALATAVAMMASVGIMVGSFRRTVQVWMDDQLPADLYLSPAVPPGADRHPTLAPDVPDIIAQVPGVVTLDRFRAYSISYEGLPATLGAGESRVIARSGRLQFLSGNRQQILERLPRGDYVVVSEPFANKHHVRVGSLLLLPLGEGIVRFEVLGIYYDYGSEAGVVVMDRQTLLRYLPGQAPSNIAVYLAPGAVPETVRRAITEALAGRHVAIFLNREIRAQAVRIFDRTFAITYALEVVAIAVAVMGIAGALLAVVIDRRRELGLLRFLGASTAQVRRLILFEAGLLGLLANLAGLVLGFLLSLVLIYVINKQSFGWTIQFHWPVALLLAGLTGVYAATILAALYPARVATRLVPIEVIHEE